MGRLASREQQHAWALRAAWASRSVVSVRLDEAVAIVPRIRGTVERVAATGAFVLLLPEGDPEPWHVPCELILSIRRPHFSEPVDVPPEPDPEADTGFADQLPLFGEVR